MSAGITASGFDDLDLDELHARQSSKWRRHPASVLPAWVAEMDFPVATPIRDAVAAVANAGDYGYPVDEGPDSIEALGARRLARRFGWQPDPALGFKLTDVMRGMINAIVAFTEPGDGVLVTTPIYPPFLGAIADNHRRVVEARLRPIEEGSALDVDALAVAARDARLLLWCNPHNPCGRSFSRRELDAVAQIVDEHDLLVAADEIHADLTYQGATHTPFASLGPHIAARTFSLTSATKAFNLAGVRCAAGYCGSEALLDRYTRHFNPMMHGVSPFGIAATRAAWTAGDDWLARCVAYLDGNRRWFASAVAEHLPAVRHRMPDATYLAWLDARGLALECPPAEHFLDAGKVAFSDGAAFGEAGEGFVRVNLATSRAILEQIVDRMVSCVR
jgi:cysteine-S-conjugate beta-lyase